MATLITLFQLLLVYVAAYVMGYALVKLLLPRDLELEYGALIMPTVGYLGYCMVSFSISASFGLTTEVAAWSTMGGLAAGALAMQMQPEWRVGLCTLLRDMRLALVLMLPMALVTLLPLFFYGADTYLGAVNPDYFAGLVDNYFLLKGHSISTFGSISRDTSYPIDYIAGHLSASARFGSGMFGIAVKLLLGVEIRTALTLSIAFFLLSLPLTLYFFCRVVLEFDHRVAKWSAWLIGVSAPTAMSYLYFYLGQNSGLPALPLMLAACYLMLERKSVRTLVFCAILANALFVNYFAMLPYALAPTGALGLYMVATRRLSVVRAFAMAFGFVGAIALLKLGNIANTIDSMRAWMNIIGQSLQGQFFLDFLTESFFAYFFGVMNYPSNPWLVRALGYAESRIAAFGVGLAFLALWGFGVRRWAYGHSDKARKVFIISALIIYVSVWARYSFAQQYGYAVFKMSSWLQFVVVPFMAYAIYVLAPAPAASSQPRAVRRSLRYAGLATCGAYVLLNFLMSLQYAYNGTGKNTDTGYIVNHFGTPGNRDYFELLDAIPRFVAPQESVGLVFTDSIRNYWTSYYLPNVRQSILAHESLPGDDENLPDVQTGKVVDYYGNVMDAKNAFFHGGNSDDFYLTWTRTDLNQDIVYPQFAPRPLWENRSFRLFRASDSRDILFTGRGFYRLEYFKPIREYFFPRVIRWSAEGGEFYLLRPRFPGQPYRLVFDILVGYEHPSDSRTLEIWQDGRKVQELTVTSSARVVTEPFRPVSDVTKLVVRIKERNRPLPRELGLWNKEIPADYRRMNAAFANVSVLAPDAPLATKRPALNERVGFMDLHPLASRFNGLQLDGWMADTAQFTIASAAKASRVELDGFAPGNLGLTYPLQLTFRIGGREERRMVSSAGPFKFMLDLDAGAAILDLTIGSPQSREIGEENIRHKVVKRSVRVDSLTFR